MRGRSGPCNADEGPPFDRPLIIARHATGGVGNGIAKHSPGPGQMDGGIDTNHLPMAS